MVGRQRITHSLITKTLSREMKPRENLTVKRPCAPAGQEILPQALQVSNPRYFVLKALQDIMKKLTVRADGKVNPII